MKPIDTAEMLRIWAWLAAPATWRHLESGARGYVRASMPGDGFIRGPWPGFVGTNYANRRIVLCGINGGIMAAANDPFRDGNREIYSALESFRASPADRTLFREYLEAAARHIPKWPFWRRFFSPSSGLELQDLAYINALPLQTVSPATGRSIGFSDLSPQVRASAWRSALAGPVGAQLRLLSPAVIVVAGVEVASYVREALRGLEIRCEVYSLKARALSLSERDRVWRAVATMT